VYKCFAQNVRTCEIFYANTSAMDYNTDGFIVRAENNVDKRAGFMRTGDY